MRSRARLIFEKRKTRPAGTEVRCGMDIQWTRIKAGFLKQQGRQSGSGWLQMFSLKRRQYAWWREIYDNCSNPMYISFSLQFFYLCLTASTDALHKKFSYCEILDFKNLLELVIAKSCQLTLSRSFASNALNCREAVKSQWTLFAMVSAPEAIFRDHAWITIWQPDDADHLKRVFYNHEKSKSKPTLT